MIRSTTVAVLATALLAVSGTRASAVDQTVPGKKLVVKSAGSKEALKFAAKGVLTIPAAASSDDPSVSGATMVLSNPTSGETFTFHMPAAHWKVSPKKTAFRYSDKALAESDKVRAVVLTGKVIKIATKKTGITLNEATQGGLSLVLASGSFRYCAKFDDGSVVKDAPGRFAAKNSAAPTACPAMGTTTTTTTIIGLSTTTLTLPGLTTTTTAAATTTTTIGVTTSTTLGATTTTTTAAATTTTTAAATTTTTAASSTTTTTVAFTCGGIAPLCGGTCPLGQTCTGVVLSPCTCQ